MSIRKYIVHDRTLLGAADSYIRELVHVRPRLADAYEEQMEQFTERWLADGGDNVLSAVDAAWLRAYVAEAADSAAAEETLRSFYAWVAENDLVAHDELPLSWLQLAPETAKA